MFTRLAVPRASRAERAARPEVQESLCQIESLSGPRLGRLRRPSGERRAAPKNRNGRDKPGHDDGWWQKNKPGRSARLLFPIHPLAALVALLRLDGERRDRTRFQALDRDRLAGFLAETGGGLLGSLQRPVAPVYSVA